MQLDFDGFRKNMVEDYESIVEQLNKSEVIDDSRITVDAEALEVRLIELRNDIVMLCGIINPETGKSLVDRASFKIDNWSFDKMLDEQGF